VIFHRKLYPELRQLTGDTGGRDLFVKYENEAFLVEPGEGHEDFDVDTPEEYLECLKAEGNQRVLMPEPIKPHLK
jgi:CTP:molybdopterin cytidylyltransferase MocA